MKNITYIFSQNRKTNLLTKKLEAREFYYGADYFEKENNLKIIEFNDGSNRILKIFDRLISRYASLPFYTSKLTNLKNFKTIYRSDYVFLINEGVGFSSIFLIIFSKIFNKNLKVSLFVMGLYSKKLRYRNLKFLHSLLIKILVFFMDDVLFLGEREFDIASKMHSKKSIKKLKFVPFCIDTEFWSPQVSYKERISNSVIFIGNDSNRDFDLLISITKSLTDINFIIVSSNPIFDQISLPNVTIYKGVWGSSIFSDYDIKKIYESAKLSIIPLKQSSQPSGQSVALQSMSMGVPVMITDTIGFWEKKAFKQNENIIFIKSFEKNDWIKKITEQLDNLESLEKISKNSSINVQEKYNLQNFYATLNEIVNK